MARLSQDELIRQAHGHPAGSPERTAILNLIATPDEVLAEMEEEQALFADLYQTLYEPGRVAGVVEREVRMARGDMEKAAKLAFWAMHIRKKKFTEDDFLAVCRSAGVPVLEARPKAKRGKIEVGENVRIDRNGNQNEANVAICEEWHDEQGEVVKVSGGETTIKFRYPRQAEVIFNGDKPGKSSGFYRQKPMDAKNKTMMEFVYTKDPLGRPPTKTREESVDQYIERGFGPQSRSWNYYSGPVNYAAKSKGGKNPGTYSIGFFSQQRGQYTNINPSAGTLYYMGILGRRPGGFEKAVDRFRAFDG